MEDVAYEFMLRTAGDDEAARATVTRPETEDLRMVLVDEDRGTYGDAFIDTLKATPVGESAMTEDDNFYIVFTRVDILEDEETLENYRPLLLNELRGEEFDSELATLGESLQFTGNEPVLTRFTAAKLKLDDAVSN
jgi:hypothetical protein